MAADKALARDTEQTQDRSTVLRLRRGIGVIGSLLPFALLIGVNIPFVTWTWTGWAWSWLPSMSGSYYTQMGNIFVASMCAIGIFLIAYRNNPVDERLTTIAGILAVLVAVLPTKPSPVPGVVIPEPTLVIGKIHLFVAWALFVMLAYICLMRFTRLDAGRVLTPRKLTRNRIYRFCGWTIVAAITACLATFVISESLEKSVHLLFWAEAVAVLAFGIAWLVKADWFILAEKAPQEPVQSDKEAALVA